MSDVIDTSSPIEVRNGRRVHSSLTGYGNALVGRIDAWLTSHPGLHSPSKIARGAKCSTHDAAAVLSYLDDRAMFVVGVGNGCWRNYATR
ncbi:hypothetical protein I5G86_gp24 [Mycobacterium phage DarthP]|uniref:Uncharacterized protein n=2 Tax=Amginevirus TaxID=2946794 RepID=A0A222ZPK5_9CAUD|nr:hypothetical protein I5G85_gp24 [Mycobacterium phage Amohnition]YP_009952033.1 hypothetical protein I5G86_gp24 [Mycobacterium phage DarthP]ASR86355.1 hypothetical protein SEA_AMOHNITION_75 [Mycobacterium phage Amohnition]ASW31821.1 hypothetical protein SEA_DARTHP_75 [Mycobacterium phage DarthP]